MILSLLSSLTSRVRAEESRYFDEHRRGWFWYEIIKELGKKEDKKPIEPPHIRASQPTVEDIRKKGEELFNRAVIDPTPENVHSYMAYQKLMIDRSQQFAEAWRNVLWEHPDLDETVHHPTSTLGIQIATADEKNSMREVITKLSQTGELIFFFRSTCPYCQEESRLLKALEQNYSIGIMGVSLDGQGLDDWQDYQIDRGQAQNLGVTEVPALFLLIPPDKVIRVSTGLIPYDELEKRLYIAGREVLEIKQENYPSTEAFLSDSQETETLPILQSQSSDNNLGNLFQSQSNENASGVLLHTGEVLR
jgi:conjugal transfer pilus assembly protein TraF